MKSERAREIYEKIKKKGISAIDEYIAFRKAEELFLDFKRSADDGKNGYLHQDDRKNLAKAISGFGNSEGGVIIWGVECSKDFDGADVAKAKYPIENVERFISLLQNAISGCTIPPHSKVENYGIKGADKTSGFVITLIPKSNDAPHQCIYNSQYFMRAGSNFVPVPHAVLAGMFGRRPQPWVFLMFSVGPAKINKISNNETEVLCQIGFMITNNGLGIARDTFLNAEIIKIPGPNCKAWFDFTDQVNWTGSFSFGFKLGIICKEGFRIPPRNFAQPIVLNLTLVPPFEKELHIKLKCGCEGSESHDSEINSSKDNVEKYYKEIINTQYLDKSQSLVEKLFKIKELEGES
ncbi:MAG: ATP-binding protein [Candidatus Pacearchaeota archaeon]